MSDDKIYEDASSLNNRSPTVNGRVLHNTDGEFSYFLRGQMFTLSGFSRLNPYVVSSLRIIIYCTSLHLIALYSAPGFVNEREQEPKKYEAQT